MVFTQKIKQKGGIKKKNVNKYVNFGIIDLFCFSYYVFIICREFISRAKLTG